MCLDSPQTDLWGEPAWAFLWMLPLKIRGFLIQQRQILLRVLATEKILWLDKGHTHFVCISPPHPTVCWGQIPTCGLGSRACSLHAAGRPAGLLPAPSPGSSFQCHPTDPGLPLVLRSPKPSQEHWASRAVSFHGAQETLLAPLEGHSALPTAKRKKTGHTILHLPFSSSLPLLFQNNNYIQCGGEK